MTLGPLMPFTMLVVQSFLDSEPPTNLLKPLLEVESPGFFSSVRAQS